MILLSFELLIQCHMAKFASNCGATVSRNWRPNVTHVIAATDANDAYTRTLKVLMAILNGKWIVTMDCKLSLYSFILFYYIEQLSLDCKK